MKIISFSSVKGGTAKSVSSLITSFILKESKKVLLIDVDPQNSISSYLISEYSVIENCSISNAFDKKKRLEELIVPINDNLHIIPSDISLAEVSLKLWTTVGTEMILKDMLTDIEGYDYVIIDTPPSLEVTSLIALGAADIVIVPSLPDFWSVRSAGIIIRKINEIQKRYNHNYDIVKILITMYEKNRPIQEEIIEKMKNTYGEMVLPDYIHRSTEVQKSIAYGEMLSHKSKTWKEYQKALSFIFEV